MREVIYPAIYKHFKEKYYATMGESIPTDISIFDSNIKHLQVKHTETNTVVKIFLNKDGSFLHDINIDGNKLAVYKALYDDDLPYVRPLHMFISEVDKEKYPDIDQRFRFELIRY